MRRRYQSGYTLVEIMIAVSIVGLLAAIVMPNLIRSRQSGQMRLCIDNLRQLDGAKQQWALEKGKISSDLPALSDIKPFLGRGDEGGLPWCPADDTHTFGNSYQINNVTTPPACLKEPDTHNIQTGVSS